MTIKPIRTEADNNAALKRISAIFDAGPGTPEADELDVLTTLVEAFESKHYPIDPPTAVEALQFRMEQGQFTRGDLVEILGSRAKVTEVLARKRALSKAMIVRLHAKFAIPCEVLLRDAPAKRTKRTKPRRAKREIANVAR